jgi:hypothetical protein
MSFRVGVGLDQYLVVVSTVVCRRVQARQKETEALVVGERTARLHLRQPHALRTIAPPLAKER